MSFINYIYPFALPSRISRVQYLAYSFSLMLLCFLMILSVVSLSGLSLVATDIKSFNIENLKIYEFALIFLMLLSAIYTMVASIMLHIKRLHDINLSGFYLLIPIIIEIIIPSNNLILVFICKGLIFIYSVFIIAWPGSKEANSYGVVPEKNTTTQIILSVPNCLILLFLIAFYASIFIGFVY